MKTFSKSIAGLAIILSIFINSAHSQETNKISKLIADVVRMSDAKVAPEVIRTYIENIGLVATATPNELIYMSSHGVSNNIVQLLIVRNHETRVAVGNIVAARRYPESYEFFYNMYLLPRARYNSQRYYPQPFLGIPHAYGYR